MLAGKRSVSAGFTLIELLVTLAVAIILATIAVPGFQDMMAGNRLAADYNEVLSGLNNARSEAIKRREEVTFKVTSESPWEYRIYRTGEPESPLRIRSGQSRNVTLSSGEVVEFNSLGRIVEDSDCADDCELVISHDSFGCRVLEVNHLGRVARSDCDGEVT